MGTQRHVRCMEISGDTISGETVHRDDTQRYHRISLPHRIISPHHITSPSITITHQHYHHYPTLMIYAHFHCTALYDVDNSQPAEQHRFAVHPHHHNAGTLRVELMASGDAELSLTARNAIRCDPHRHHQYQEAAYITAKNASRDGYLIMPMPAIHQLLLRTHHQHRTTHHSRTHHYRVHHLVHRCVPRKRCHLRRTMPISDNSNARLLTMMDC